MPSCASMRSKASLTPSSGSSCETKGSKSSSPSSQRWTSRGTSSRPFRPPNEEPQTRRPVMSTRGTTSSASPLPGDPRDGGEPPPHARRLDCLAHHADVARGLEGVVRAEAVRQVEDRLDRVGAALEQVRRALPPGELEPVVGEVDADDALRAGQPRPRHGTEADHPRAEHDAGAARLHPRRGEHGAQPGGQAAGEQARAVERRLRGDLGQGDLGHDGRLGEGRRAHEVAQGLARARQPRRPVGQEAAVLLLADRQAEVRARAAAVRALPALGRDRVTMWSPGATRRTSGPTASTLTLPAANGTPTGQVVTLASSANFPAGAAPRVIGTVPYRVAVDPGVTDIVAEARTSGTLHDARSTTPPRSRRRSAPRSPSPRSP